MLGSPKGGQIEPSMRVEGWVMSSLLSERYHVSVGLWSGSVSREKAVFQGYRRPVVAAWSTSNCKGRARSEATHHGRGLVPKGFDMFYTQQCQ